MNLGEIRADVRSLILEPTPGFRSNAELNRWINQAHQELGMVYRLDAAKQIKVDKGVIFHYFPDDLLKFKGAWDTNNNSIPLSPIMAGVNISPASSTSDSPQVTIFPYGKTFALVPAPADPTVIRIFYERFPALLASDEDIPEIPAPYHRYLVAFATMKAFQKDEAFDESSVYQQEYQQGLTEIAQQKSQVSGDQAQVLNLANAGMINAAEAAEWLNLPMKQKIEQRVLENKALTLLSARVISKEDLIDNTVFPDWNDIAQHLATTANDLIPLPPFFGEDDINDD